MNLSLALFEFDKLFTVVALVLRFPCVGKTNKKLRRCVDILGTSTVVVYKHSSSASES